MPSDEWIKTLADGRRVKFTYQELLDEGAFITAQVEGNKVVYSIVLTNAKTPLSREEVESHFEGQNSAQRFRFLDPILRTATLDNRRAQA